MEDEEREIGNGGLGDRGIGMEDGRWAIRGWGMGWVG